MTLAYFPSSLTRKISILRHPNLSHSLSTTFSTTWELKTTHAQIIITGNYSSDLFVIARLLAAAAISPVASDLHHAQSLFSTISIPTRFMYNTMIRAFSQNLDSPAQSVLYYTQMRRTGILPDRITFPFLIKSVSTLDDGNLGRGVHCDVVRFGMEKDVFIVNNLITMYSGFPYHLSCARKVFDQSVNIADVISWTAMLTGYANAGDVGVARWYFDRMPERNMVSWNSMLAGYAKAGKTSDAELLFDEMPHRNVASWSTLISGYAQCGLCEEALTIFKEAISSGVVPNESALVSAVSACAQSRKLELGEWVNIYINEAYKDDNGATLNVTLQSALIDMYGKCGNLEKALQIFRDMPMSMRNTFSWNSMITSLAMNGSGRQALTLFWKMKMSGVSPNAITFIGILTACSHSRLVDEGHHFFDLMVRVYKIKPSRDHYGCMVDLIARAGLIKEAIDFTESMPVEPHAGLLGALVGACRIHGEVEVGEELGKRLIEMEPYHSGRYALLYNIYAAARRWNDAAMVSTLLRDRGIVKISGNSSSVQSSSSSSTSSLSTSSSSSFLSPA